MKERSITTRSWSAAFAAWRRPRSPRPRRTKMAARMASKPAAEGQPE